MKQQRSIGKRLLSFTVSCVTAASFLPAAFWQNTFAAAAEQSANEKELKAEAFKALGLSTKNPSGFDEKDEEKNPFGKETVAFAGADELLIAAMGGSDNRIIGQNAGTVGQLLPVGLRDESLKMIFSDTATTLGPGGSKCSPTYISELALATDTEDLEDDDFNVLDADINKGTSVFAPHIYLGYKTTKDISKAITDIIVVDRGSSNTAPNNYSANGHNYHLTDYSRDGGWSNFKNTNGNLNAGAKSGKNLYLYYSTDKISPEYLEGQSFTQAVTRIHLDSNSNDAVSEENLLGGTASAYNV